MNAAFSHLMSCLPRAPHFQWNWQGLSGSPLSGIISDMKNVHQQAQWHGEGNVWTHTQMVCEALSAMDGFRALSSRRQGILAVAALLHDIGKISCTRLQDGMIVAPGHGATGAQMARKLLWLEFGLCGTPEEQSFREAVCMLVRRHGLPLHLLERDNPSLPAMQIAANASLCPDFTMDMLFMLSLADVRGRIADDLDELSDTLLLNREFVQECGCLHGSYPFASEHTRRAYLSGRNVWPGQALYDDSWGEVILMCGLPGTGKDSWIQRFYPDLPMVSLDNIRRKLNIQPTDNQGTVIQTAREEARKYLRARQPFVWNATSLTASLRQNQVNLFEDYGAAVRIVYLETEWTENLRRNADRRYSVPENVVLHMLDKLSPPEQFESRHVQWLTT